VAARITEKLSIPTIGIGAGPDCDGQVLVIHDLLGFGTQHKPKFVRPYANLSAEITRAVSAYCDDVRNGSFPSDAESYHSTAELRENQPAVQRR
jgi:3-methyl-2-oxobutanoate hydroxymethyltransferase